jgi:hypothetical protein
VKCACGKSPTVAHGLCAACYQKGRRRAAGIQPKAEVAGIPVAVRLPKEMVLKLRKEAKSRDVSVGEVIRGRLVIFYK